MSETDGALEALSQTEQEALQQYISVTDQNVNEAIPLLRRCQWNVQIAISRFFDGEPAETIDTIQPDIPPPQDIRRQETLLNGIPTQSSQGNSAIEPAPRVVPQPESQINQRAPFLLSVIITPLNILYGLLSRYFRFMSYLFPFLPRIWDTISSRRVRRTRSHDTSGRRPLNPRDTAARFKREFEEEYGSHDLPFLESGYAQAFDIAKRDMKFLVVILMSKEHDETSSFIQETLLSSEVTNLFSRNKNNVLLWGGDVQDSEAYQVSTALHCTKFPFAALIVHTPSISSTSMSVVARMTGPLTAQQFVSKIQTVMSQNSEALNRARASRAEQQVARTLREQQDSAYERSLAQDRERTRLKKEAEAQRQREEAEAKAKAESKELRLRKMDQWKRWRAQSISPEPGDETKDAVRISLRMPSGDRIVRRFRPELPIEELYAFVECFNVTHDNSEKADNPKPENFSFEYKFRLVSPMPREVYELGLGGSIRERIGRSGNLIVERTDLDDESEEDA